MTSSRTTPRRLLRTTSLVLAAITMLAAGALPACVPGMCCPLADAPTVHSQMPCCQGGSSIAPRDLDRARPATFVTFAPQAPMPAVLVQRTGSFDLSLVRAAAVHDSGRSPHHDPSPPLFLLNAQFLI